jgi:hypothetical protein
MSPDLKVGIRFVRSIRVGEQLTAPAVSQPFVSFADMPSALANAFMVRFI